MNKILQEETHKLWPILRFLLHSWIVRNDIFNIILNILSAHFYLRQKLQLTLKFDGQNLVEDAAFINFLTLLQPDLLKKSLQQLSHSIGDVSHANLSHNNFN